MPYVMVMGTVSAPHLVQDEGPTIYGLNSEERTAFVNEISRAGLTTHMSPEKNIRVAGKGLSLMIVNKLHALFGYDVVSHAMAMTNANRELISFTLYKKKSDQGSHSSIYKHHSHRT